MVTVKAPNAPCMHTQTNVRVGSQGEKADFSYKCFSFSIAFAFERRCTQLAAASTATSTPTPLAK